MVTSGCDPRARRYLKLPFACNLVSYGTNIVASVNEPLRAVVSAYLEHFSFVPHAFETPNLLALDDAVRPFGHRVCFMAEYFLPQSDSLPRRACRFPLKVMAPPDFSELYLPEWSNALCKERPQLDRLCVGAYDGGTLIGLAGASADCEDMYQIGVDVLPAYRGKGVAAALTVRLAEEIFACGKIPFYCAAWSNIASVNNACSSGFRPAWVELTVKDEAFTADMMA